MVTTISSDTFEQLDLQFSTLQLTPTNPSTSPVSETIEQKVGRLEANITSHHLISAQKQKLFNQIVASLKQTTSISEAQKTETSQLKIEVGKLNFRAYRRQNDDKLKRVLREQLTKARKAMDRRNDEINRLRGVIGEMERGLDKRDKEIERLRGLLGESGYGMQVD